MGARERCHDSGGGNKKGMQDTQIQEPRRLGRLALLKHDIAHNRCSLMLLTRQGQEAISSYEGPENEELEGCVNYETAPRTE